MCLLFLDNVDEQRTALVSKTKCLGAIQGEKDI